MTIPLFPVVVQGLAWHRSKYSPREFCSLIQDNSPSDPQRNHALHRCFVDEVVHYQHKAGSGYTPHELLVAHYSLDIMDESGVTIGKDRRVATFERLEAAHHRSRTGPSTFVAADTVVAGASTVGGYLRAALAMGSRIGNSDTERIGNNDTVTIERQLSPTIALEYEPVASLRPAPGALLIVDCAITAEVVTSRACDYTPLQYNAVRYACTMFKILQAVAAAASDIGPARKRAGRCGILRVVDAEGRLLLPERPRTTGQAADQVVNLLRQFPGLLKAGDESKARAAFLENSEQEENALIEPVQEVLLQVGALRARMWESMDGEAEEARKRIDGLLDEIETKNGEIQKLNNAIRALGEVTTHAMEGSPSGA
ncbi:hypothetical protein BD626DRAFT_473161 [Schizophyllum amplum]|uniref:Uncharacterized protein n=1 Tax=Schizophyllum amplum TaxID=97359 RepID=A0A550CWJ9_9AGAR|nr:hypothetical protein BD626DRAFT_473161 [Auriculariopsis ampla]